MLQTKINGQIVEIEPGMLLAICEYLLDAQDKRPFTKEDGDACAKFSDEAALVRFLLFAEYLGVPPGHEHYAAQGFAQVLEQNSDSPTIAREKLQAVIFKLPEITDGTPYQAYAQKVRRLLKLSRAGFIDEAFGDVSRDIAAEHQPWLDPKVFTHLWPKELMESPAWGCIESPIIGIPDQSMDTTWVNLTLREVHTRSMSLRQRQAWEDLQFDNDAFGISAQELLLTTKRLTIVTGLPGAGKSTLIKWLARYVISEPKVPFGIPAVISLRHYAREKQQQPSLTLFQYFLRDRGVRDPVQVQRWQALYEGLRSSEQSDAADAVLWLLDGWDEVPTPLKDLILPEIRAISLYPCILTTRHSGSPLQLPAHRYLEILGLKHGAALDLAYRWLVSVGREAYYSAIEIGLEESPELRQLARSPFLLTLMCALATNPNQKGEAYGWLPKRFGEVLTEALSLIYAQHNMDPKQNEKFTFSDQKDVARFAWWLFAEVEGGPQFVFDQHDYSRAGFSAEKFNRLLMPSRLIAKPNIEARYFQFHHASFQEYLAASTLADKPNLMSNWCHLLLDANWSEVMRYVVEIASNNSDAMQRLWAAAQIALAHRDRYGLILARVANLLSVAGYRDGGQEALGRDIRDDLWQTLQAYASELPTPLIKAFIDLDATGFAKRILDQRIASMENSSAISWLALISIFDLEPLFEEACYREVLTLPQVAEFCPELPDYLFEEAEQEELLPENATLFNQAVKCRDVASAYDCFLKLLDEGHIDNCYEALSCFQTLPEEEVANVFFEIATADEMPDIIRGTAVSALMMLGNATLCSRLIIHAASLSPGDPRLLSIIGNLEGYGLNSRETHLILEICGYEDVLTQCAAIEVLAGTRSKEVPLKLLDLFPQQQSSEVRQTMLSCFEALAEISMLPKLWALKDKTPLMGDEWESWLRAVLAGLEPGERCNIGRYEQSISEEILSWVQCLVSNIENDSAEEYERHGFLAILAYPKVLGKNTAKRLLAIASQLDNEEQVVKTILAVGLLGSVGDVQALVHFLKHLPKESSKIRAAVCEAIGELSPKALFALSTAEADLCRARLAYRENVLYVDESAFEQERADGDLINAADNSSNHSEQTLVQEGFSEILKRLNQLTPRYLDADAKEISQEEYEHRLSTYREVESTISGFKGVESLSKAFLDLANEMSLLNTKKLFSGYNRAISDKRVFKRDNQSEPLNQAPDKLEQRQFTEWKKNNLKSLSIDNAQIVVDALYVAILDRRVESKDITLKQSQQTAQKQRSIQIRLNVVRDYLLQQVKLLLGISPRS